MTGLPRLVLTPVVTLVICASSLLAQPDLKQMSGVPLPVRELPAGTVTVRVVRGSLANPIQSQTVEITGAGQPRTAVTDGSGRAEFKDLPVGGRVRAAATVAGERLESQEFAVPSNGGVRLMLVAGADSGASAAPATDPGQPAPAPAQPGTVVFGDESRFVFEAGEDGLSVFYILHVENASTAPVQPEPIVVDLPPDARNATILEGSSQQASVAGKQVRISGPFAPGRTLVQIAFALPYGSSNLAIEQPLPLRLAHLAVVAQKIGDMRLTSPQITEQRDMPAQGNMYIAGRGGAVPAGDVLRFSFSGLPHHATWPRTLAMVLAVAVLAAGTWSSLRARSAVAPRETRRKELEARRERLFDELTALEVQHRQDAIDPDRYAERRRELISALERVYSALDETAVARRAC